MTKINKLLVSSFIMLLSLFYINVRAEELTGTTTGAVHVRKGPGTNYGSVVTLSKGKPVTLVSSTLVPDQKGCSAGWYQINYNGSTDRYICSTYVNLSNSSVSYFTQESWNARTNSNSATIRKGAGTNYGSQGSLIFGTEVKILSEGKTGNGCNDKWYKISYHNNKTGYICSTFVYKYENITSTNEEYSNVLSEAGFPTSYHPFLTHLHNKYPNWNFRAINTNIDFKYAVSGEEGKNYTQSTISTYRTSSTPVEGKTWFRATTGLIAFYLDPRNFLNEKTIFMFENLGYDSETQTSEVVKSIFGSGSLSGDIYTNAFMKAANDYNVSPVHLASRVKQEVGVNGNKATNGSEFTWEGKTYSGYYNFYNIGAYGSDPLIRGLAYAAGLLGNTSYGVPWNTVEKSIGGGAKFIANGYISKGQYTMYFQKFNVSPTSSYSRFTHQYMTNVNAPTAESISTYSSYNKANQLNTAYTFAIPIYKNMPEDFVTLPPVGDTNNDLTSISINGINISEFDKDVLEYNYNISSLTTKVTIGATLASTKSSVEGLGEYELTNDVTTVNIIVTSEAGLSQTYKVIITKVEPVNTSITEILNSNYKITNNYLTSIEANTNVTTIIEHLKAIDATLTISIKDVNNNDKTTGLIATGDKITITKDDLTETYIIAIRGDTSGDGKINALDLLQVQKHILKSTTLTLQRFEAADTNYDGKINALDLLRVQKYILGDLKFK